MEKVFELILRLIEKAPWASEWEKLGAHQALADAWDDVAEKLGPALGIDTTAEDYVAPVAQPPKEAVKVAPPAQAPPTFELDYDKLAAAMLKAQAAGAAPVPAPKPAPAPDAAPLAAAPPLANDAAPAPAPEPAPAPAPAPVPAAGE